MSVPESQLRSVERVEHVEAELDARAGDVEVFLDIEVHDLIAGRLDDLRGELPNVKAGAAVKADVLNQRAVVRSSDGRFGSPVRFGRIVPRDVFAGFPLMMTLKGPPVCRLTPTPNCQSDSTARAIPVKPLAERQQPSTVFILPTCRKSMAVPPPFPFEPVVLVLRLLILGADGAGRRRAARVVAPRIGVGRENVHPP